MRRTLIRPITALLLAMLASGCGLPSAGQPLSPTIAPIVQTPLPDAGQPTGGQPISAANAAQLQAAGAWGHGTPTGAAFSPDGRLLAVSTLAGATIYNGATRREILSIDTSLGVPAVTFSPDGSVLAVPQGDSLQLWSMPDATLKQTLDLEALIPNKYDDGSVEDVAFSADGRTLAVGWSYRTVRLLNASDGTLIRTLNQGGIDYSSAESPLVSRGPGPLQRARVPNPGQLLSNVALAPDGSLVAAATDYDGLRVWRGGDGTEAYTLGQADVGDVYALAFSSDGAMLAVGGAEVQLRRATDGALVRSLSRAFGDSAVTGLAFSADGTRLVAAHTDGAVQVWALTDGATVASAESPIDGQSIDQSYTGQARSGAAFAPDGNGVVTTASAGLVRFLPLGAGQPQDNIEPTSGDDWAQLSPDGDTLALASRYRGAVQLWRTSDRSLLMRLERENGDLVALSFSPDGATLAAGLSTGTVQLWRVADGSALATLSGHAKDVDDMLFSADGATLATAAGDHTVRVWRVSDGVLLHELAHPDSISDIALAPDGVTLATISAGSLRRWRVGDGALLQTEQLPQPWAQVVFSPDGNRFLTFSQRDGQAMLQLWSASDGTRQREISFRSDNSVTAAFSPDGALIAVHSWQRELRVFAADDGTLRYTADAGDDIRRVAFTSNGSAIAAGLGQGQIKLWTTTDGAPLATLTGHNGAISLLAFAEGGRLLLSRADDGVQREWIVRG